MFMGRLDLNINDALEMKFRDTVYRTRGFKKGNLTIALEDAIQKWVEQEAKKILDEEKKRKKAGEKE
jgi:hypothetical protein